MAAVSERCDERGWTSDEQGLWSDTTRCRTLSHDLLHCRVLRQQADPTLLVPQSADHLRAQTGRSRPTLSHSTHIESLWLQHLSWQLVTDTNTVRTINRFYNTNYKGADLCLVLVIDLREQI